MCLGSTGWEPSEWRKKKKREEIQGRPYRIWDPDKPEFDVLVILDRIPVKLPRLDNTSIAVRATYENSTLGGFKRAFPLGSEGRGSARQDLGRHVDFGI